MYTAPAATDAHNWREHSHLVNMCNASGNVEELQSVEAASEHHQEQVEQLNTQRSTTWHAELATAPLCQQRAGADRQHEAASRLAVLTVARDRL